MDGMPVSPTLQQPTPCRLAARPQACSGSRLIAQPPQTVQFVLATVILAMNVIHSASPSACHTQLLSCHRTFMSLEQRLLFNNIVITNNNSRLSLLRPKCGQPGAAQQVQIRFLLIDWYVKAFRLN